jgi:glyoxylase-like metal-dependent hydrolase (beta-lactamase superfamily II)
MERGRGVVEVVCGEAARCEIERRIGEGKRGRVGLSECDVRRAHDAGAPGLHHLECRVRTDGEGDHWSDAAQRVSNAAAKVEGALPARRRGDGEEPLEILAGCVRRARDIGGSCLAELRAYILHGSFVHFSILPFVRVGRFQVEIFSDGIFRLDGGLMYGIVPKPLWEKDQPADERNRVALNMNCLLIRDGAGNVVVVETGAGPKLTERSKQNFGIDEPPRLLGELARRGVRPDEVTLVVNTHLHFDHSGGNTHRDGDKIVATFPRASYVFQRLEWVDANTPNERTRGSYFADDFAPLEAAGKLELIDESVEILPGIRLDRIPGHTRGTQTVRVSDAGETLFFSSDFMPDRHHLRLPWIPAIDLYPLETLAAKKMILPRAVSERWIVGFTHDLPRFGRITEHDGKLRFDEVAE